MADIKFPSWLSTKWSADNADILLIADSQDSNRSKGITKANLLSGVTTDLSNKVDLTSTQDVTWQKTFENLNNKTVLYLKDSAWILQRHISHWTDFSLTESGVADNRLVVKAWGNVWIGVSPDSKLQVWADWSVNLRIGYNGTDVSYIDASQLNLRNVWWWTWIELIVNTQNRTSARTSYTPTVWATSWSASSVTVNLAKYKQVGKMVFITGRMSFAKNTLSWSIYITLPVADNSFLWSITGFIGDNAGLSLNQGRTQLENTSRIYFEIANGTAYVAASDLWWWTVWVRRNGVYEAA